MCIPNFDEISQTTAEIKLLPVGENGRRPYWNSTFSFDFDLCVVKSCHSAKFRSNQIIGGGVMASYRFFNIAAIVLKIYFCVQV